MSDALVKSLREWPSMLRRTKAPLGEAIKDMQAAADRLERLQRDLAQANAEIAAVRAERDSLKEDAERLTMELGKCQRNR